MQLVYQRHCLPDTETKHRLSDHPSKYIVAIIHDLKQSMRGFLLCLVMSRGNEYGGGEGPIGAQGGGA